MPWEKSFDESEVVDKAMRVFWEKGYAATSISDITAATGIQRGSLYNAFDGKQDLFLRGLLNYGAEHRTKHLKLLESVESPREAISLFFDFTVKRTLSDPDKKGCLLINSALEYRRHDSEIQQAISSGIKEVEAFFESQIKRGQELGEIPDTVEAKAVARALFAAIVGIRVLGRGVMSKSSLRQIAAQSLRLLD